MDNNGEGGKDMLKQGNAPEVPANSDVVPANSASANSAQAETPSSSAPESSAQGGIFSTSDTRIETENLPENVQAPFAAAPASAITPTLRTESTVTGDLKLGGNERKGKKWLVIAAGAAVVASIVVGAMLLLNNRNSDETTRLSAFEDYYKLLYDGPSDSIERSEGDDSWFLFSLKESDLTGEEQQKYLDKIKATYHDSGLDDAEYAEIITVMLHSLTLGDLSQGVLGAYLAGGKSKAQDFISEHAAIIPAESANHTSPAGRIADNIHKYLTAQLGIIEIYSRAGCIVDGAIEYGCLGESDPTGTLAELIATRSAATRLIEGNLSLLKEQFKAKTTTIYDQLKGDKS